MLHISVGVSPPDLVHQGNYFRVFSWKLTEFSCQCHKGTTIRFSLLWVLNVWILVVLGAVVKVTPPCADCQLIFSAYVCKHDIACSVVTGMVRRLWWLKGSPQIVNLMMFPILQVFVLSMSGFSKFASETSARQFYTFLVGLNSEEMNIANGRFMATSQLMFILLTPLFADALWGAAQTSSTASMFSESCIYRGLLTASPYELSAVDSI